MSSEMDMYSQIAVNAACFSDDGEKMYGFAEYYNELYEYDRKKQCVISLGRLGKETDNIHMMYELIYCCGKILCIPRNAAGVYIYDTRSHMQVCHLKESLSNENSIEPISFVSIKNGKYVYMIYRRYMHIYKVDMEGCSITEIDNVYKNIYMNIGLAVIFNCKMILYSNENHRLFLFDANTERLEEIGLQCEIPACERAYFDGQKIWMYCSQEGKVYMIDLQGKLVGDINLGIRDRISIAFFANQDDVYLLLNGNEYFIFNGDQSKKIEYKQEYFRENCYYQLPFYSGLYRSYDAKTYEQAFSPVQYLRYNCSSMELETYKLPIPKDQTIESVHKRIFGAFKNRGYQLESVDYSLEMWLRQIEDN